MTTSYYGGLRPIAVLGRDQFAQHDPSTTWDDGGIATELAAEMIRELEDQVSRYVQSFKETLSQDLSSYGAHQVRDGVVDYVANGYLDLGVINGKMCVIFDASNDTAQLRAAWDLDQLIMRAKVQAQQSGDFTFIDALSALHTALPAQHVPPPQPHRDPPPMPIHQGRIEAPKVGKRVSTRAR